MAETISWLILFSLLGGFVNWLAWKNGYYYLPQKERAFSSTLQLKHVITAFAIYIGITFFLPLILFRLANRFSTASLSIRLIEASSLQLLALCLTLLFLLLLCNSLKEIKRIWKDPFKEPPRIALYDFGVGVMSWLFSFPVVTAIGQLSDLIILVIFKVENYEQVAVRYLKKSLISAPLLVIAILSIVLLAPIVEELLFRGFLQTWFKRYTGAKMAILLSALSFALFHFSASQGIGNISLVLSLFAFGCFLGFVYERQASLFASIGLHITFNALSTFRIVLFPD